MATNPNPQFKKNILPGLAVPSGLDPELKKFLQAVKEHIELGQGTRGQPKERFATIEELRKAGLIEVGIRSNRAEVLSKAGVEDDALSGSGSSVAMSHDGTNAVITTNRGKITFDMVDTPKLLGATGGNEALTNLAVILDELGLLLNQTT